MSRKKLPIAAVPQDMPLHERYFLTHGTGTLQTRAELLSQQVNPELWQPYLEAVRKPGRHTIELLKEHIRNGFPAVGDPKHAAPVFGRLAELGREGTELINPALARAVKLSMN